MTEDNSELDIRTNCPFCKVDINSLEHDAITCLHESYGVYIQAQARIDAIENRLDGRAIEAPPTHQGTKWQRIRWFYGDIFQMVKDFAIVLALLRFIFLGLGV